jgi:hypothetical protein
MNILILFVYVCKKHLEIFKNLVCELGELPLIRGLRFYKNNFQKGKNL